VRVNNRFLHLFDKLLACGNLPNEVEMLRYPGRPQCAHSVLNKRYRATLQIIPGFHLPQN